jgi:hypothetical protein
MRWILLLVCSGSLMAQQAAPPAPKAAPPKEKYTIARASSPIQVDGQLDEAAWQTATSIPLRFEWLPGDNVTPPVKTEALVTFDEARLYVGFRAEDPEPGRIRAHLTDRDVPFYDDTVGFMIDPFNDQRRAFQFRINPLGVQMDSTFSDVDGSEDWSWDAIWDSVGRIGANGYIVEVSIPLTSLRFPGSSGVQTWGFVATRDYPRSERHRLQSAYRDRNANCVVCNLEELTGFENIRPGRNLELDPTITARRTDARDDFPSGELESGEFDFEPGLTARWSPTSNITLNGAVNPDFSQVEADVAQLAVNERFALFFPEKRPFFLEGADLFSTSINAVHTRTVAEPRWGLKVSGKQSRSAGGAFLAQDSVNTFVIPSFQGSSTESLDQEVLSGVLRYRFDLGKSSTLGVLVTNRQADDYHNRLGGIDGTLRVTLSDTIRFQYLRTSTAYPEAVAVRQGQPLDSFDGDALILRYTHQQREWFWHAQYRTLDPQFRADSGFVTRVDTKFATAGIERTFWGKPGGWYSRLIFGAHHDRTQNYAGTAKEHGSDFIFVWLGPRQAEYSLNVAPNRESFRGVHYDNLRINHYFEIRPTGDFAFFLSAVTGKTIDVVNGQQADVLRIDPSVELSLARRFNVSLSHGLQRLDVDRGRLFDANLTQARLVYHFNIRTFARAIVQYTDVDRNVAAYDVPITERSKQLFTQLLFSYKVNPQTVFLAGYSDNAVGFKEDDLNVDLTKTDRTVFVKVGYAWLF